MPALPEAVCRHLGQELGAAYANLPDPSEPECLADLLGRLEQVLAVQDAQSETAFRDLFLAIMPSLLRFALSLSRDRSLAEDLVQGTSLKGWRNRHQFRPGTSLEAWLCTILRYSFYR